MEENVYNYVILAKAYRRLLQFFFLPPHHFNFLSFSLSLPIFLSFSLSFLPDVMVSEPQKQLQMLETGMMPQQETITIFLSLLCQKS